MWAVVVVSGKSESELLDEKSESELFLPPGVGHNDLTSGKAGNRQYNLHTEAS